ncbi:cytochrome P450 2D20 [Biomphalaria glabrata]|nr:cytochrome P450 2D20 [Biomphalaria glabrata]
MSLFHAVDEAHGPTKSGSSPLQNADGTILLTDKEEFLKRWAEYFEKVLNTPSIINEAAIDRLQQVPINEKWMTRAPTQRKLMPPFNSSQVEKPQELTPFPQWSTKTWIGAD